MKGIKHWREKKAKKKAAKAALEITAEMLYSAMSVEEREERVCALKRASLRIRNGILRGAKKPPPTKPERSYIESLIHYHTGGML